MKVTKFLLSPFRQSHGVIVANVTIVESVALSVLLSFTFSWPKKICTGQRRIELLSLYYVFKLPSVSETSDHTILHMQYNKYHAQYTKPNQFSGTLSSLYATVFLFPSSFLLFSVFVLRSVFLLLHLAFSVVCLFYSFVPLSGSFRISDCTNAQTSFS